MIKIKVAFLEGQLLSSQSELFENFSDGSDWLNTLFFIRTRGSFFAQNLKTIPASAEEPSLKF